MRWAAVLKLDYKSAACARRVRYALPSLLLVVLHKQLRHLGFICHICHLGRKTVAKRMCIRVRHTLSGWRVRSRRSCFSGPLVRVSLFLRPKNALALFCGMWAFGLIAGYSLIGYKDAVAGIELRGAPRADCWIRNSGNLRDGQ